MKMNEMGGSDDLFGAEFFLCCVVNKLLSETHDKTFWPYAMVTLLSFSLIFSDCNKMLLAVVVRHNRTTKWFRLAPLFHLKSISTQKNKIHFLYSHYTTYTHTHTYSTRQTFSSQPKSPRLCPSPENTTPLPI